MVDQLDDLFRTTHKVKTQQVVHIRGQRCGDIELSGYLVNAVGPVPLVVDLRIPHDRWLNESVSDKIRKYRADYNNNPPNTMLFIPAISSTL